MVVARYLGVKDNVPAYLDPSLTVHDLSTGVSFASAGSGYDPLTPTISVCISLSMYLHYSIYTHNGTNVCFCIFVHVLYSLYRHMYVYVIDITYILKALLCLIVKEYIIKKKTS